MSTREEVFYEIVQALAEIGAESNSYMLRSSKQDNVHYLLLGLRDSVEVEDTLYKVDSVDLFLDLVLDNIKQVLDEKDIDAWDHDVNVVIWEVLEQNFKVVCFTE